VRAIARAALALLIAVGPFSLPIDAQAGTDANGPKSSKPESFAKGGDAIAAGDRGVELAEGYVIDADIVYAKSNGHQLTLDIYRPKSTSTSSNTVMYIHGGGWLDIASKESSTLQFIPFLERGWAVVNVEYRPSEIALAPAAVEDCLCALRWIGRNGAKYNLNTGRLVIMGHSAGGHLALTTGMVPLSHTGLGAPCAMDDMYGSTTDLRYPPNPVKIAAIVNWYGITNVAEIIDGAEQQGYAVKWIGNQPGREEIVKAVSPVTYVRQGLAPIISIHGTNDHVVPYSQATQLHQALNKAAVPNKLISIPNGEHGEFGVEATKRAYAQVFDFLKGAMPERE